MLTVLNPHRGGPVRPLTPQRLAALTRCYAEEVAAGGYPWLRFSADERWHQRLYRDPSVDLWLITWLPSQGTQLHDHGGSSGAFTVVGGTLTESVPSGFGRARLRIRDADVAAGSTVGFGRHHIHDVRNRGVEPAVSVHAYSPPLTSMTFYRADVAGLTTLTTVPTDDPETEYAAAS